MSRLLVKNIPKYITEERFKSHFEKIGPVTDAKIIKTKYVLLNTVASGILPLLLIELIIYYVCYFRLKKLVV